MCTVYSHKRQLICTVHTQQAHNPCVLYSLHTTYVCRSHHEKITLRLTVAPNLVIFNHHDSGAGCSSADTKNTSLSLDCGTRTSSGHGRHIVALPLLLPSLAPTTHTNVSLLLSSSLRLMPWPRTAPRSPFPDWYYLHCFLDNNKCCMPIG
jgi:hypothetical protein